MKSKIIIGTALCTLFIGGLITWNMSQIDKFRGLVLANIEALANEETDQEGNPCYTIIERETKSELDDLLNEKLIESYEYFTCVYGKKSKCKEGYIWTYIDDNGLENVEDHSSVVYCR